MAVSKLDLPDDLLAPSNLHDDVAWADGRDALVGGKTEDKALLGLIDESKDQMYSENSIPLSPQWLYAKPTESKVVLSTAAGEIRPGNLSTLGILPDSAQKDVWRLGGSQEKERRHALDVESNHTWRDEERETSLLVRRERKKDDRESEYRKNERRPDNFSARETTDSRSIPSSDRWIEVPNRNAGNESRRDGKWSSRWGPDDKDKDSRTEKKMDAEKEDSHVEKQSFFANLRPLSDTDSRDKWRPRHRQEVQTGVSSTSRAAPGFGLGRGRMEVATVGFAPGRGRPNSDRRPQFSRSSTTTIGAEPVRGKSVLSLDTFRYPRAKLLDIYRKQKVTLFDDAPDGLEEVPPITESSFIMPLAFVTPEAEEEDLLKNIWKGKATSSEVSYTTSRERMEKVNDHETDAGDNIQNKIEQGLEFDFEETKDRTTVVNEVISESSTPNTVDLGVCLDKNVSIGNYITSGFTSDDLKMVNDDKHSDIQKNARIGEASSFSFEVSAKPTDNANDLFDASVVHQITDNKDHVNNLPSKSFGQGAYPEELSLFYQDPQGVVQGPFLGVDIISWFEDGFFGLDLPVCLSDELEGTPFQTLGEVMPHLKLKLQSFPDINPNQGTEELDASSRITEVNIPSDVTGSLITDNQQTNTSFNGLEHLKHNASENDTPEIPQQDMIPFSLSKRQLVSPAEAQTFHDLSRQDSEEVLYRGRSLSNMEKHLGDIRDELINLPDSSSYQHGAVIGTGDSLLSQTVQRDNDLNPLGLLWSELNGNHPKHPLSSAIPSITDKSIISSEQINTINDMPTAADVWPSNFRSNNSNVTHGILDHSQLSQFEFEPDQFNLDEHLFLQQIQKQQHQKRQLAHQNVDFSGLEHLLQLEFEQKLHFEQMQQQIQLHQQQQHLRQQHMQIIRQQQQQQLLLEQQKQQQQQLIFEQQKQQQQQLLLEQQKQQQQQLLLEQQKQQQQQLLLEQLLHQQLHNRGVGALNSDPRRVNNMVDEVLLRQHLLHESRQPRHLLQLHDPAIEQIIQAKYGHNRIRENQYDVLDSLSHSKHGQMLPFEQQFLLTMQQEQLQARQFTTSGQHPGIDEERHIGGLWSVDESGQFVRCAASPHQGHPARANQLNVMQPPRRPSSFDQPSHLERNLLHERMQQAQYEQGLHDFQMLNSIHLGGPPGSNMDLALTRLHALGSHEHQHSASQIAQFPSNARPHQHPTTEEFTGLHKDEMEQNLLDQNEQIASNFSESYLNRLQGDAEKKMRSLQLNGPLEDLNLWASQSAIDGISECSLQENFHQKMLLQSQPVGLLGGPPTTSIENSDPWFHSQAGDGYSFNPHSDKLGLNNMMKDASLFSKSGQPGIVNLEGHANSFQGSERLSFRSSAAFLEQKQVLSDINQIERQQFVNSINGESSMEGYAGELRMGNMQDLRGISSGQSGMEIVELGTRQVSVKENEELKFNPPSRHTSTGSISNDGGAKFNFGMGESPPNEEMINNRVSGTPVKMHMVSSQPGLSEMISSQPPKGKNPTNSVSYENKRDTTSNQVVQSIEVSASNKKDMRFRRAPSISDTDYTEPTFSDMLKSTKKSMPEVDAHGDAPGIVAGGKNSKKKGKKGRQIDPSLLGFKVHSKRMLMGEIQRLDD